MIDRAGSRRSLSFTANRPSLRDHEASRILIPVTLSPNDRAAIRLGLQIAVGTDSPVTIACVTPLACNLPTRNWLDSIDRLHCSLDGTNDIDARSLARAAAEELKGFVRSSVVPSMLVRADLSLISRPGDFCDEVLRLACSQPFDLVVLPGEMLQGWIPTLPSRLRRKLQQMGKRILAVWPEASSRPSPRQASAAPALAY